MVGLLSRHKGKSEKREFAIAVDTLSSWAGAEPMEVWWQRGSHAGKLRPVPPGHDGDLHINQTIKLEATLFKVGSGGRMSSVCADGLQLGAALSHTRAVPIW